MTPVAVRIGDTELKEMATDEQYRAKHCGATFAQRLERYQTMLLQNTILMVAAIMPAATLPAYAQAPLPMPRDEAPKSIRRIVQCAMITRKAVFRRTARFTFARPTTSTAFSLPGRCASRLSALPRIN